LQATVDKLPQYGNVVWGGRLDLAAALADVAPTPPPVTSVHPWITGTIASKPSLGQFYKVRVIFNEAVIPNSFTTSDVALTGPNGGIAISGVTPVSGTGNTQFDITFATQTAPGTYRLTVGPHIQDAAGHEMLQAFTASFTVRGSATSFSAGSGPLNSAIQDFHTTTSTINIGQNMAINKLVVNVNITHSWVGDLVIKLRGPDGTNVTLFNRRGGKGHNIHTTFDDAASATLAAARAPYTGSVRPENALAAFAGKNTHGSWQLIVQDKAAGNEGTLISWSLTFQGSASGQGARSSAIENPDTLAAKTNRSTKTTLDAIFSNSLNSLQPTVENPDRSKVQAKSTEAVVGLMATPTAPAVYRASADRLFALDGGGAGNDIEIAWEGFVQEEHLELAEG
jgi:subtilisin-like proprotein convertase family protein